MRKIGKVCLVVALIFAATFIGAVGGYAAGIGGKLKFQLQTIAVLLSEASSTESDPIALTVEVVEIGGKERLRCKLINVSGQTLRIPEHALPCKLNHSFAVTGISVDGRSVQESAFPISMLIPDPPTEVELAAAQTLTIDGALKDVYPVEPRFRATEALLLWSYRFERYVNTGITLLPKKR